MRICMLVSAGFPPREGMGFYIWNLSRFLLGLGHEVHIITRGQARPTSREVLDGITIWRPPFLPVYPFHVHLHGYFVDRLLANIGMDFDVLHLHMPLVRQPAGRIPTLVTVHTPMKADIRNIPANTPFNVLIKLQAPISYRLEQEVLDGADGIAAVARSVADELRDYGIDPRCVAVLGNAVDTSVFFPGTSTAPVGKPYFLTAGRLAPRKGLEDLLSCAEIVAATHPDVRFLIAGTGPREKELQALIKKKDLTKNVSLTGHISDRAQMVDLYRGATAYIHSAHYEGLATVMLEAMACARPVISTAVSGALDVIVDGQNGVLVPPRAPKEMAAAAIRLLENPGLAQNLGREALRTIQTRYTWEAVARLYEAEYEKLAQKTGA